MIYGLTDEALETLGAHIQAAAGTMVSGYVVAENELTISAPAATILELLTFLRDDAACRFHQLVDLCGVDYPERPQRFDVVYHLLSMTKNHRVRVKVRANETVAVPSIVKLFPAADWFEREAFDLFGISFDGHPDLRRLLTDYGFQGHPLRKDFPMTGYVEVRYDDEQKRVVYEPVKITEFRDFDFLSPWEGAQGAYGLPNADPKGG
jgi:NADH-quinone oxidoreductase subunit C